MSYLGTETTKDFTGGLESCQFGLSQDDILTVLLTPENFGAAESVDLDSGFRAQD
jgi:hypothetical protein